ncbi:PREDICTED: SCY1-like protein 2 isoform X2 [Amphimedon queenslandica]|uniref:Protein kinase domain-containing protein n=1 Tax=Amphimedon queenslandica TaxID=400682 RepID=A0AAN0J083_AMPQE|nr:PREDICTED: SCY1-like protein 2 isoform X2 [Amphimedon queenslandica]|eukprot:XP_019850121.1 PREDICTED: SCY1-like protein 2 isoform X2 [Amphimedon queenslandica]
MSLLGKLKTAIKGNPVLREYELGKQVASAGPGLLWKVFNGEKKSTKQAVSVFIFYKTAPELEKVPKKEREALFELLKKGPTHLAKFRHPKILTVDHPVEESSDCLAFATEPIVASLANVLGYYANLPSPLPPDIKEYQVHTLEVHYGLLQLAEGLNFLHNNVKMRHGNLCIDNITISTNGDWKLAGFNFASSIESETPGYSFKETKAFPLHPTLNYLAPEVVLSNTVNEKCDLYSFGMLIFAIYNSGKPLFDCKDNLRTYKQNIEMTSRISESMLGDTPFPLRSLVRSLLTIEPSVRPDSLQIAKHEFFDDVLVNGLRYIETLVEKSDIDKSQWFKGSLSRIITKYPKRLLHHRILPALGMEFRNHKMIPFVLPLVLLIADDCSIEEYSTLVLPILIPAFRIHDPIQIPLIFLQKMDLLLKLTNPEERRQHLLPMILGAMESSSSQVQELCMSILPTFADMIDYTSMKHSIIPRITEICVKSSSESLRIKSLVAVGQMLDSLDKGMIHENIIPAVYQIRSREPGVLMAILGIIHKAFTSQTLGFDKKQLACKILPFLIPLSIENSLNVTQFNQFMMVIKEMLKKIESDQRVHLEQLAKMEEQTKSTVSFAKEVSDAKAMEEATRQIENKFGGGKEDSVISKLGSTTSSHTHNVPSHSTSGLSSSPAISSKHTTTVDDIFSGLDLNDIKMSANTPSPSQVTRKIDFSEAKATPSFATWDVPSASLTPPINRSSVNTHSDSIGMGTKPPSTGMGWSSSITTQSRSDTGGMGMMQPAQTHSNNSGMGMGLMQPAQNRSDTSGMGIMQPAQTHSGSMGTGIGWSSNIESQPTSMGMGLMQPMQSGSSGMGMETLQPTQTNTGWSSNIQTGSMGMGQSNTGMGILQPSQTNTSSTGMGWSSSINPQNNMQPVGGSMGMGGFQSGSMGMGGFQSGSMGMGGSQSGNMGMGGSQFSNMGMGGSQSGSMGMGGSQSGSMGMGGSQSGSMGMGGSQFGSMGMGGSQSGSMGMGGSQSVTGWSSNIESQSPSVGLMQPVQTHSGSSSTGVGLLQPMQTNSMGMLQPSQPHTSTGSMGMGPAPGANPFANFGGTSLL